MWHCAQYRGEELIVLGHDPRRNDCMLVKLSGMPMNEQQELRRIAASRAGQESSHLIPILRRMTSPSGQDWFSYLAQKMQQRNSPVFTLPIKEIQDSLDDDQKAIFKGYGKGRRNSSLDREDLAREQSGEYLDADKVDDDRGTETNHQQTSPTKLDNKLDALIEDSRRTQELLSRLIGALTASEAPVKRSVAKPRRPSRSGTAKKRSDRQIEEVEVYEAQ